MNAVRALVESIEAKGGTFSVTVNNAYEFDPWTIEGYAPHRLERVALRLVRPQIQEFLLDRAIDEWFACRRRRASA